MRLRARLVDTPTVRLECLANGNGNGTKRQTVGNYVTVTVKRGLSFRANLMEKLLQVTPMQKFETCPQIRRKNKIYRKIKPPIIGFN